MTTAFHNLSTGTLVRLCALGLVFWFAGVLFIRYLQGLGWYDGSTNSTLLLFLVTLPISVATVWIIRKAAALQAGQLVPGVSVATVTAALVDGLVLAFVPSIYADTTAVLFPVAVSLIWGFATVLAAAIVFGRLEQAH